MHNIMTAWMSNLFQVRVANQHIKTNQAFAVYIEKRGWDGGQARSH